jgi:alkylation response protein AidB-like acyl-CoA dehydrogenase
LNYLSERYAPEHIKEKYLGKLISMELSISFCLTEPESGSDASSLKTEAKEVGDQYVINGKKCFITGGGVNDLYLVMARTGLMNDNTKIILRA